MAGDDVELEEEMAKLGMMWLNWRRKGEEERE